LTAIPNHRHLVGIQSFGNKDCSRGIVSGFARIVQTGPLRAFEKSTGEWIREITESDNYVQTCDVQVIYIYIYIYIYMFRRPTMKGQLKPQPPGGRGERKINREREKEKRREGMVG
jgi:hypothetical protein